MSISKGIYGVLFAEAKLVSVEDYLLMKQCLDENLVETIYYVPTYVLNDEYKVKQVEDIESLMAYNKEIISTLPHVKIWNSEMALFEIAEQKKIKDDTRNLLLNLKTKRQPEDILLSIAAFINYRNEHVEDEKSEHTLIKLIANSTLIYSFKFVKEPMWSTLRILVDGLIIDRLQVAAATNQFKSYVLSKFDESDIYQLKTDKYQHVIYEDKPEYNHISIYGMLDSYKHNGKKYVEIFKAMAELLMTGFTDKIGKKRAYKNTIALLFENDTNEFILQTNDNNELEPLTYSYDPTETKATIEYFINILLKEKTGYDIPGEYVKILGKDVYQYDTITYCYINLRAIPMDKCKWNLEYTNSTDLSRMKKKIIKFANNYSAAIIDDTYGHNSKMLDKALKVFCDFFRKQEFSKPKQKLEIKPTSETVTEKDAITTYQWNTDNNPYDFLNSAKLVISVTYQGFPSQEDKNKGKTII